MAKSTVPITRPSFPAKSARRKTVSHPPPGGLHKKFLLRKGSPGGASPFPKNGEVLPLLVSCIIHISTTSRPCQDDFSSSYQRFTRNFAEIYGNPSIRVPSKRRRNGRGAGQETPPRRHRSTLRLPQKSVFSNFHLLLLAFGARRIRANVNFSEFSVTLSYLSKNAKKVAQKFRRRTALGTPPPMAASLPPRRATPRATEKKLPSRLTTRPSDAIINTN